MLTEDERYSKRRTNSKYIGDVRGDLEIIGSYRLGYGSFYEIKCHHCNLVFDKPVSTWKHLKYCPMCKPEKQTENKKKTTKFDAPVYYKYRNLIKFSKNHNIPFAEEWDSFDKFLEWCSERKLYGSRVRMYHKMNMSHIGPDTVRFERVTGK